MPISCEPADLSDAAKCLGCIPQGMQLPILINLLCEITGMDCDPATLVEAAKCFVCIPANMQWPVIIYLLCNAIGSGGIGGVTCGTSDPSAAPTTTCGIYYRSDTGAIWVWDGTVWQPIISI